MKSPSSMKSGRFHLPSVGARFRKLERKLSKGVFSNLLIPAAHLFRLM
jgi:hypothetical protein